MFKQQERRDIMPISYDKLWKMLIDAKMNRTELKNAAGISSNIVAKMGRNEFVSMESLYKICLTLNCNIGDIVDIIPVDSTLPQNNLDNSTSERG